MRSFFLVDDTEDIDPSIRYRKTKSFLHFTAASLFLFFFYCCLQQHNDSKVTTTVVGGDRFVPVVVDIDCAQGAKSARNVFQSFSL
jgi:hypothetical protein